MPNTGIVESRTSRDVTVANQLSYHDYFFIFNKVFTFFSLKSLFDYKDISDLLHKMGNMMDFYLAIEPYTKDMQLNTKTESLTFIGALT